MEMDILPPTSQGADEVMEQVVVWVLWSSVRSVLELLLF
jgi:hypothetical protein